MQQELFATPSPMRQALPRADDAYSKQLRADLEALAAQGIFLGTSSWKYPEWQGAIYLEEYASKAAFERNCLQEHSRLFPLVGGDFTFYNWPSKDQLETIAAQTPDAFKIALKCTDAVTIARFPNIPRWKERAGRSNPDFLNPKLFAENFLLPAAQVLKQKLGPILFEFTAFPADFLLPEQGVLKKLLHFLEEISRIALPQPPLFAVEWRNRELAAPSVYSALLNVGAVPIMSSWTRMVPMDEQWRRLLPHAKNAPFLFGRPVLRPGKLREGAEREYAPFTRIRERVEPMRAAVREMAEFARSSGIPAYFTFSNTIEGCAHRTIQELAAELLSKNHRR